jgi:hypothetical protein
MLRAASLTARDGCGGVFRRHLGIALAVVAGLGAFLHELCGGRLDAVARAKGSPISPLTIRAAREAAGLSQREAGRVFGGGPTAFYKYETAKAVP